jgi:hypothetical protein
LSVVSPAASASKSRLGHGAYARDRQIGDPTVTVCELGFEAVQMGAEPAQRFAGQNLHARVLVPSGYDSGDAYVSFQTHSAHTESNSGTRVSGRGRSIAERAAIVYEGRIVLKNSIFRIDHD